MLGIVAGKNVTFKLQSQQGLRIIATFVVVLPPRFISAPAAQH